MAYTAEQLSDLQCIRDAAVRYCRGVDRLDPDEMKSAYWPDAIDNHGLFVGNAHEFADLCMVSHTRFRATGHCTFNHLIELEPDGRTARGEVYNITWLFHKDQDVIDTWHGRYLDRYEQRDGEWRIIERICVHEGTDSRPATPMEIDSGGFRQGSFDRPANGRAIGP